MMPSKVIWIVVIVVAIIVIAYILYLSRRRIENVMSRMNTGFAIAIVVIAILALAYGIFRLAAPTGANSLLARTDSESGTGDELIKTDNEGDDEVLKLLDSMIATNEKGDGGLYVTITGKSIVVGNENYTSVDDFQTAMRLLEMDEASFKRQITIIDNYAVADTYKGVLKVLDDMGVSYFQKQVD